MVLSSLMKYLFMAIYMLWYRDIPFYTPYPVPFVCIFFMTIIPASSFCLIKLRALCLWIILISLATHREDSNKPKEQSHLMIAQLNTVDFCQMETLKTKTDVSLYVLKRMKLYEHKISFRLSTSFLNVKSGLLLPEEWTSKDCFSWVQRPHLSILLPLWSPHGWSTSPFLHSSLCPS